jgi:hypothetical protein
MLLTWGVGTVGCVGRIQGVCTLRGMLSQRLMAVLIPESLGIGGRIRCMHPKHTVGILSLTYQQTCSAHRQTLWKARALKLPPRWMLSQVMLSHPNHLHRVTPVTWAAWGCLYCCGSWTIATTTICLWSPLRMLGCVVLSRIFGKQFWALLDGGSQLHGISLAPGHGTSAVGVRQNVWRRVTLAAATATSSARRAIGHGGLAALD